MKNNYNRYEGPIGIFDSGYGGLSVLSEIKFLMPEYDYIYLGDNMRSPYGNRSFETIYQYTLQAVKWLFAQGCHLVILACNTASAKALRTIQQIDLPQIDPSRRVLGVIRPTAESVHTITKSGHIGVLGTEGTIRSLSYNLEIGKLFPQYTVTGQSCPMFVPLVENGEYDKPGADYFVKEYINSLLSSDPKIDTIILGCTHYPLLFNKIKEYLPTGIKLLSQGKYIAESLKNYLERHPDIDKRSTKKGTIVYYTTDVADIFAKNASIFMDEAITAQQINIDTIC